MSENNLSLYTSKGLTEEESRQLVKYNESGRPGVAKLNVDALQALYNVGYSCQEINEQFPEYPMGAILLTRVQQDWDKKKVAYRKGLEAEIVGSVKNARVESVKMVADVIAATNIHWKQELMRYLANPTKEKAPEFLPKTMHQYGSLATLLKDLTEVEKSTGKDANLPGNNGGGLPTIIINNNTAPGSKPDVTVATYQDRVKAALIKSVKKNDT